MYVFLACTESKADHRCKAEELYSESAFFRKTLAYARTLVKDSDIYILSAKHHIVRLTDVLEPYSLTLRGASDKVVKEWSEETVKQMKAKHISFDKKAVFLTGEPYRRYLLDKFKESDCPFKGNISVRTMRIINDKIGKSASEKQNESVTPLYKYLIEHI